MYIALGVVTSVAVMASCSAVVQTLAHQVIEITQYGYSKYINLQKFRYAYAQSRYRTIHMYTVTSLLHDSIT